MPYVTTEAVVLRRSAYSETSLVVSLYTRDFGRQSLIAKGARRQSKAVYGGIDPLTHINVVFLRREAPGLQTMAEWDVLDGFHGIRQGLDRLYAATYAVELTGKLTEEGDPNASVFYVLLGVLRKLAAGEGIVRLITSFELGLLQCAGVFPLIDRCTGCGKGLDKLRKVFFSSRRGGCVCAGCVKNEDEAIGATKGTLAVMRLVASDDAKSRRLKISPWTGAEMRRMMRHYLRYVLGEDPRMWPYLKWHKGGRGSNYIERVQASRR